MVEDNYEECPLTSTCALVSTCVHTYVCARTHTCTEGGPWAWQRNTERSVWMATGWG